MIKVIVVDDHPIVTDGIKKLIDSCPDIRTIGTALCGKDCKELLQKTTPDVILLDINLPDINGMDLCRYIRGFYPFVRIIALTGFKEYFYMQKCSKTEQTGIY